MRYLSGEIINIPTRNNNGYISNSTSNLIIVFLFFWFWPLYRNIISASFIGNYFSDRQFAVLGYFYRMIMFFIMVHIKKSFFNKRFLLFLLSYIAIVTINILLVSYRYYVILEAIAPLSCFMPISYTISILEHDELLALFGKMYSWCIFHSLFIIALIMSEKSTGLLKYGEVSSDVAGNLVGLLCGIFILNRKTHIGILAFITNYVALLFFGSRMPIVATTICAFVLMLFANVEKKLRTKFVVIVLLLLAIVIVVNMKQIFELLLNITTSLNVKSRTISKFTNDFGNNRSYFEMAASSGREVGWQLASDYVKSNMGFPGGFGVMRNISNNHLYFSHNIFLDLAMNFGVFMVPIFIYTVYRIKKIKSNMPFRLYWICYAFGISFFFCSLTGAHYLVDQNGIMFWSLLFFAKRSKYSYVLKNNVLSRRLNTYKFFR